HFLQPTPFSRLLCYLVHLDNIDIFQHPSWIARSCFSLLFSLVFAIMVDLDAFWERGWQPEDSYWTNGLAYAPLPKFLYYVKHADSMTQFEWNGDIRTQHQHLDWPAREGPSLFISTFFDYFEAWKWGEQRRPLTVLYTIDTRRLPRLWPVVYAAVHTRNPLHTDVLFLNYIPSYAIVYVETIKSQIPELQLQPFPERAENLDDPEAVWPPPPPYPPHSRPAAPDEPPLAQNQPAQSQPAQGQPAQGQPAQGQPAQGQPAQGQHTQGQQAQGQHAQGQPARYLPGPYLPALLAQYLPPPPGLYPPRPYLPALPPPYLPGPYLAALPAPYLPAQDEPVQVQSAQNQPVPNQPAQSQSAQAQPVQDQAAQAQSTQDHPGQNQREPTRDQPLPAPAITPAPVHLSAFAPAQLENLASQPWSPPPDYMAPQHFTSPTHSAPAQFITPVPGVETPVPAPPLAGGYWYSVSEPVPGQCSANWQFDPPGASTERLTTFYINTAPPGQTPPGFHDQGQGQGQGQGQPTTISDVLQVSSAETELSHVFEPRPEDSHQQPSPATHSPPSPGFLLLMSPPVTMPDGTTPLPRERPRSTTPNGTRLPSFLAEEPAEEPVPEYHGVEIPNHWQTASVESSMPAERSSLISSDGSTVLPNFFAEDDE
ncbi:hypothetical protein B0T20DRAFT_492024, partial [Sordaria brevicollis]